MRRRPSARTRLAPQSVPHLSFLWHLDASAEDYGDVYVCPHRTQRAQLTTFAAFADCLALLEWCPSDCFCKGPCSWQVQEPLCISEVLRRRALVRVAPESASHLFSVHPLNVSAHGCGAAYACPHKHLAISTHRTSPYACPHKHPAISTHRTSNSGRLPSSVGMDPVNLHSAKFLQLGGARSMAHQRCDTFPARVLDLS